LWRMDMLTSLRYKINRRAIKDRLLRVRANWIAHKYRPFTMIPKNVFVDNLMLASLVSQLPGCVVECGVWRGGMIAGIAEVLGADRHYYLFDSFEGLPAAKEIDGPTALRWQADKKSPVYHDNCAAAVEYSKRAMRMSPAERVTFVEGWFAESLPGFVPKENIAVLRLDADWYDSTMQCLDALYPHVVPGGVVIIDDYYTWDGCAKAVHDYLSAHKLPDRIRQTRASVCYIIRP
jgi:O-methyltransferase